MPGRKPTGPIPETSTQPRAARLLLAAVVAGIAPSLLALPTDTPPHQFVEDVWGVPEGLPQTAVQTITQGRDGRLWIGTQDGLARFDGMEFEHFHTGSDPGLAHDYINALLKDPGERLWIGTDHGLSQRSEGEIREIAPPEGGFGPVYDLDQNAHGLWIAAEEGLYRLGEDGEIHTIHADAPVFGLESDDETERMWAGGRGELLEVHGDEPRVYSLGEEHGDREIRSLEILGEQLWLGTNQGLFAAPRALPMEWTRAHLPGFEIENLLRDRAGSLWVVTLDGGYRLTPGAERPRNFRTAALGETDWLRYLHEDDEGNLWIGAHLSGLHRLRDGPFRRYTASDGLVDGTIWTYYRNPEGVLWAGSNDAGAFRQTADGDFEQALGEEHLPSPVAMGFLHDSADRFWVITRNGATWWDPETLERQALPPEIPDGTYFAITEDSENRIWLATRNGLYWWRDGEVHRIGSELGLTQDRTRDVVEDSRGRIWVATDTGVFRGGPGGFEEVGAAEGLSDFGASAIFEFNGEIWITAQGATARIDADDRVRLYREEDGINTQIGSFLAVDDQDHLWSLSHEGIERIPLEHFDELDRGERKHLDPEIFGSLTDPIPAQCNGGHGQAGHHDEAGYLWCPSLDGALRLDMEQALEDPPPPRPLVRRIRAGGQSFSLEDRAADAVIELPLGEREIEIDYSGLHLRHPEGVQHRYRLHGFEEDWTEAGERRTAFYTNLPPGEYRFAVHAANERGVRSADPATVTLRVPPRMHETSWFQGFALTAGLLLLFAGYRFSLRRLHRRRAALERMVRQRTQELRQANRRLQDASLTDPLTGLRNRRFLDSQIEHDIAKVQRDYERQPENPNRDITFVMLDVDHFKEINDRHGHRVGDQVLAGFARLIGEVVRESDYVIRWGGEEFLIVARYSERSQVPAFMNRLLEAVRSRPMRTEEGLELECTCSMGVAVFPLDPDNPWALDWECMIEIADQANYLVKEQGRDGWCHIAAGPAFQAEGFMERFRESFSSLEENSEIRLDYDRPR